MLTFRARWVLPIAGPPVEDGWVAVAGGRIAAVGRERRRTVRAETADVDLGRVALLPGLVNAHTHLELSYLAGAVPPAGRFTDWIRGVMALRREQPDASADAILDPMREAIAALPRQGTALVGDISNTLVSVAALGEAGQPAAVFYELIRLRAADADALVAGAVDRLAALVLPPHVRVSLTPHAPYSVSPRLFQAIRRVRDRDPFGRMSVHLAESPEETELLDAGTGAWRQLLDELRAWDDTWIAPGCGTVEYLDRMRVLDDRTLAVHAVQCSRTDLDRLAALGTTVVTCPRSNRYVGVGDPPVAACYAAGVRVAVGTDSLASAPDLSVWPELGAMRRLAPEVPAARLLESATRVGADALGFGSELGTIEPGKRAALVAVPIPPSIRDVAGVQEYLVSGIDPGDARWVGDVN
jgi:cytosine/adenosine deaminase-related metal-dependent hydrolase